jgi:hypothetical protein
MLRAFVVDELAGAGVGASKNLMKFANWIMSVVPLVEKPSSGVEVNEQSELSSRSVKNASLVTPCSTL